MAGERHGRGMDTACYVWIGLNFLMRMGRQTDIMKLTVDYRNFANAPRKPIIFYRPRGTAKYHKSDLYSDTWFESWPILNMLSEDFVLSFFSWYNECEQNCLKSRLITFSPIFLFGCIPLSFRVTNLNTFFFSESVYW